MSKRAGCGADLSYCQKLCSHANCSVRHKPYKTKRYTETKIKIEKSIMERVERVIECMSCFVRGSDVCICRLPQVVDVKIQPKKKEPIVRMGWDFVSSAHLPRLWCHSKQVVKQHPYAYVRDDGLYLIYAFQIAGYETCCCAIYLTAWDSCMKTIMNYDPKCMMNWVDERFPRYD